MKKLVILLLLSGCQSVNLGKTVAGGANGSVDYCIRVLATEAFCIQAKRSGDAEPTEKPE